MGMLIKKKSAKWFFPSSSRRHCCGRSWLLLRWRKKLFYTFSRNFFLSLTEVLCLHFFSREFYFHFFLPIPFFPLSRLPATQLEETFYLQRSCTAWNRFNDYERIKIMLLESFQLCLSGDPDFLWANFYDFLLWIFMITSIRLEQFFQLSNKNWDKFRKLNKVRITFYDFLIGLRLMSLAIKWVRCCTNNGCVEFKSCFELAAHRFVCRSAHIKCWAVEGEIKFIIWKLADKFIKLRFFPSTHVI